MGTASVTVTVSCVDQAEYDHFKDQADALDAQTHTVTLDPSGLKVTVSYETQAE